MMKKLIYAAVAASLLCLGWIAFSGSASSRVAVPLFQDVLRAHGGREAIASTVAFHAQAVRLTSTQLPAFFERRLRVSVDSAKFKRHTTDPLGLRDRGELFDGNAGFYAASSSDEQGRAAPQVLPMDSGRVRAARFSVETFGLLPLLRRCADPATEAIFEGRTPGSLDKFRVKTPAGDWSVYADQSHLIRKVEIGDKTIQFADYRSIGGLQLPFIQRLSVGDRLVYELVFSVIDPNPTFPADYFNPETLARETAR
jgi:hypothetical protein